MASVRRDLARAAAPTVAFRAAGRGGGDDGAWLHRLRTIAVLLPVAFLVVLHVAAPAFAHRLWPGRGDVIGTALTGVAAVAFGLTMFSVIERGHRARLGENVQRSLRGTDALCQVLLRISRNDPPARTLATVVAHTTELVGGDEAGLCLEDVPPHVAAALAPDTAGCTTLCVTAGGVTACRLTTGSCPARTPARHPAFASAPLGGAGGGADYGTGRLWLARHTARPFTHSDTALLDTLGDLASVTLDQAARLEDERQGAIRGERERIAREMHDGLAQALGVTHLRLHSLTARPEVAGVDDVRGELTDLADLCHDAYQDVREAILGLRLAGRADLSLEDSLAGYVEAFTRTSGVPAELHIAPGARLELSPPGEVQVIRIVQEALTNVRKHAAAARVTVSVTTTSAGTRFEVADDGRGFDTGGAPLDRDRFGLASMRERAELVGGTLSVDSTPGAGTRVAAVLPVAPHAQAVGA